ncbi:hypothetical protein AB0B35_41255, partial [Catellatospora sp. NPDC049133]
MRLPAPAAAADSPGHRGGRRVIAAHPAALDDAELARLYPRADIPWLRVDFMSSPPSSGGVVGVGEAEE